MIEEFALTIPLRNISIKTKCDHSLHLRILAFGSVISVRHVKGTVGLLTKVLNKKKQQ